MAQAMKDIGEYPIATQPREDALVKAVSQREIAEAQGAMLLAQRFPRDEAQARDRILIACQRPGLAEGAMYTYARGGTDITGPSIRLAEAIAQEWGNLTFGIRELEQRAGQSTMEAFCWDLERNVRQVKQFQVPHVRHTRQGSYSLEDPRDIYETVANQGARRLRACILGLIPGDIVEAAVEQCEATIKAKADTSPAGLKKMLDGFGKFGVTKEQIEARLQRKLDAITPAQVVGLMKVYTSLKDGMSGPADWFATAEGTAPEAGGTAGVKAALRKTREKTAGEDASPAAEVPETPAVAAPSPPPEEQATPPEATPQERGPMLSAVEQQVQRLLKVRPDSNRKEVLAIALSAAGIEKEIKSPTELTDEELAVLVMALKEQE